MRVQILFGVAANKLMPSFLAIAILKLVYFCFRMFYGNWNRKSRSSMIWLRRPRTYASHQSVNKFRKKVNYTTKEFFIFYNFLISTIEFLPFTYIYFFLFLFVTFFALKLIASNYIRDTHTHLKEIIHTPTRKAFS